MKDPASRGYLTSLLTVLEKTKKEIGPNDAIDNDVVAAAYVENFALKVFGMTDSEDRAGKATRGTAKKFLVAANLMELLQVFDKANISDSVRCHHVAHPTGCQADQLSLRSMTKFDMQSGKQRTLQRLSVKDETPLLDPPTKSNKRVPHQISQLSRQLPSRIPTELGLCHPLDSIQTHRALENGARPPRRVRLVTSRLIRQSAPHPVMTHGGHG